MVGKKTLITSGGMADATTTLLVLHRVPGADGYEVYILSADIILRDSISLSFDLKHTLNNER